MSIYGIVAVFMPNLEAFYGPDYLLQEKAECGSF